MTCMMGGFRGLLHNEVRDLVTVLCKDAGYKDVEREPKLQPLQGEQFEYKSAKIEDDARSDVRVRGFWRPWRNVFFDVTACSPFAPSNKGQEMANLYKQAESRKRREYSERIRHVEHADFMSFVISVTGGLGPQATTIINHLATRMAERQEIQRSVVISRIRIRLSFAILRSSLVMLRGSRGPRVLHPQLGEQVELAVAACRAEQFEDAD